MSGKSYLSVISEDGEKDLFQYENAVPFFWYCFLDETSFDEVVPEVKKLYEMSISNDSSERDAYLIYAEDNPGSADIMLSKELFRKNAQEARAYVKGKFPDRSVLFDDYIHYIDSEMKDEDILAVSIFDNVYEFDGAETFVKAVKKNISAVKHATKAFTPDLFGDEVFALTGMDKELCYGFREKSQDYLDACTKEEEELLKSLSDMKTLDRMMKKKKASKNIASMLVVGAVLIYMGVTLYKSDGPGFGSLMPLFIGIGAVGLGLRDFMKYQREKAAAQAEETTATASVDKDNSTEENSATEENNAIAEDDAVQKETQQDEAETVAEDELKNVQGAKDQE
jgi:hypothetical protein